MFRGSKGNDIGVKTESRSEGNETVLVFGKDQALLYSKRVRREGSSWAVPDLEISLPGHLVPVPFLTLRRLGRPPVPTGRRMIFAFGDTQNPGADGRWIFSTLTNISLAASEGKRPDQQKQNLVKKNAHLLAVILGLGFFALMAMPLMMQQLGEL